MRARACVYNYTCQGQSRNRSLNEEAGEHNLKLLNFSDPDVLRIGADI